MNIRQYFVNRDWFLSHVLEKSLNVTSSNLLFLKKLKSPNAEIMDFGRVHITERNKFRLCSVDTFVEVSDFTDNDCININRKVGELLILKSI